MRVAYVRVTGSRVFRGYPVEVIAEVLKLSPGQEFPHEIELKALTILMTGFPAEKAEELHVSDCEKMLAAFLCRAVERA